MSELIEVLRKLNPRVEIELQHRPGACLAIKVDLPPEQLILPEGCVLRGPDVGDRYLSCGENEYVVTDEEKHVAQ